MVTLAPGGRRRTGFRRVGQLADGAPLRRGSREASNGPRRASELPLACECSAQGTSGRFAIPRCSCGARLLVACNLRRAPVGPRTTPGSIGSRDGAHGSRAGRDTACSTHRWTHRSTPSPKQPPQCLRPQYRSVRSSRRTASLCAASSRPSSPDRAMNGRTSSFAAGGARRLALGAGEGGLIVAPFRLVYDTHAGQPAITLPDDEAPFRPGSTCRRRRAFVASVVGTELICESHDSFALAGGSDSLAVFASCGAAAQRGGARDCGCDVGRRAPGFARSPGGRARRSRPSASPLCSTLAANTIGHDGKEEVVVEHVGLLRITALPLHGEAPPRLRQRRGDVHRLHKRGARRSSSGGIPPWRVGHRLALRGWAVPALRRAGFAGVPRPRSAHDEASADTRAEQVSPAPAGRGLHSRPTGLEVLFFDGVTRMQTGDAAGPASYPLACDAARGGRLRMVRGPFGGRGSRARSGVVARRRLRRGVAARARAPGLRLQVPGSGGAAGRLRRPRTVAGIGPSAAERGDDLDTGSPRAAAIGEELLHAARAGRLVARRRRRARSSFPLDTPSDAVLGPESSQDVAADTKSCGLV